MSETINSRGQSPAYRQHCLDQDPTYRDSYGLPLIRICFDFTENERKMVRFGTQKIRLILEAPGASHMNVDSRTASPLQHREIPNHPHGRRLRHGQRSGHVGRQQLSADVDFENVFVVGASAYPQNAGFNPTDTLGALSYRAADGLVNHYLKKPGPLK
ncbi:MAG: hypothetical protein ABI182_01680 [Candidatus Baltobacteraceae bacterium]